MPSEASDATVPPTPAGDNTRADASAASGEPTLPGFSRETSPRVTLPAQAYTVGREIAQGGMGCVLEAEDCKLGRIVAMKVMRLEGSARQTKFVDEQRPRRAFVRHTPHGVCFRFQRVGQFVVSFQFSVERWTRPS